MNFIVVGCNQQVTDVIIELLFSVNGVAYPGEFLAILGARGSGKTTLLNTLTYRSPSQFISSGLICANAVPANPVEFKNKFAFIEKEDLFVQYVTVKEHLLSQALLRMDKRISLREMKGLVEHILIELDMKDIEDSIIKVQGTSEGLSRAEKKKLSLASEILTNPNVIFCDEPTTGLDAFMALNVGQVLKRITQSGKTVICSIHEPNSELYALFDKILIISEGRVAFSGTSSEANLFFQRLESPCPPNYNPADYFIHLLEVLPKQEKSCKHAINMICDAFERSEMGVHLAVQAATLIESNNGFNDLNNRKPRHCYKSSCLTQFGVVLWRSCLSLVNNTMLIKTRFFQSIVLALLVGIIFFRQQVDQDGIMNINGALYIILCILTYQNVFHSIHATFIELPVFFKENRNGLYRTDVYFLSKFLAEFPIHVLIPSIFMCVCYFLIGLNPSPSNFFVALGITILVSHVATSFGFLVSCLMYNTGLGKACVYLILVPFILLGGYFLNLSSTPKYLDWLSYLSWFRYGNEALLINQWANVPDINCTLTRDIVCILNGKEVLELYDFADGSLVADTLGLLGLIGAFKTLAFLILLFMTYKTE